ncbi:MAG: uracil-DNA glycosylase [Flavobacteriales bacterium]|jgi:uracil-DNA glycosylase|nr:uracil-DNA glycosylase [Flavobacteriales bacterium]
MSIVNKAINNINPIWKNALKKEFELDYFKSLTQNLENEMKKFNIFPSSDLIFNALNSTNLNDVKVVIIGQDPYFKKEQANGLCFSVQKNHPYPPSLKNIFKALENDLSQTIVNHGDLTNWANQGVLLLNTCLTVKEGFPNSHKDLGWHNFTDAIIKLVSKRNNNVCFFLWGKYALNKKKMIDSKKHLILETSHPSPLSAFRGFLNCKHFSKANEFILNNGGESVDWNIY